MISDIKGRAGLKLIMVLTVMSLAACQKNSEDDAALSSITSAEYTPTEIKAGAHGNYDPHSKLSADKHIQVALQHRNEGRVAEALDVLDRAISRYSKQAQLYSVRASILMERGDVTSALQDLENAIKLQPNEPLTLVNRAHAYRSFGRISESLADLDKAISLEPDLVAARFNRGVIYFSSKDYQAALADFDRCIAVDPHSEAAYFNRASTYDAIGKQELAITDMKRFIELTKVESRKVTANELIKKWQSSTSNKQNKNKSQS